jgi:anthranilate synthase component II
MLLVIDNYDSFVFNLVHYAAELGAEPHVIRNDAMTAQEIFALRPQAILISPGPKAPRDAGCCLEVLREAPQSLPILGVCLGHQALGEAFGGKVVRAKEIRHGKTSPIMHNSTNLFEGLPSPFRATRYHSLAVERAGLPDCLEVTAWTQDGEIMGLAHQTRPICGVQFHPESIESEHGHALMANFLRMAGMEIAAPWR